MKTHSFLWLTMRRMATRLAVGLAGLLLLVGAGGSVWGQPPGSPRLSVDELMKLRGGAFYQALEKEGYECSRELPLADLLRILARMRDESGGWKKEAPTPADGGKASPYSEAIKRGTLFDFLFNAACEKADRPALVALADDAETMKDDYIRCQLFESLLKTTLRLELDELLAGLDAPVAFPPPPAPEDGAAPPPGLDERLPESLRAARKAYLAALGPLRKSQERWRNERFSTPPGSRLPSYPQEGDAFFKLLREALENRGGPHADRIAAYGWGGGCIVIGDWAETQRGAIFLALLRERRWPEAVGMALQPWGWNENRMRWVSLEKATETPPPLCFLERCGFDWETLFLGGLADAERGEPYSGSREKIPYFLPLLATHGSEKVVPSLVALSRLAKPEDEAAYLRALAQFLEPRPLADGLTTSHSCGDLSRRVSPASEAVQREILAHLLRRAADPQAPQGSVSAVVTIFVDLHDPATKPVLRQLLRHPAPGVAQSAVSALANMGEKAAPAPTK